MRDFDGTSDYLSFDSTHIDEEAKLAVSVWFEHDTEALERMLVFATTGNKSFMLVTNGETTSEVNFLSTYGHSSRLGADASSRVRGAITLNAKQHFCGTVAATTDYTRDILSAYVNGAAITNTGGTSYYTTGGLSDRLTIAARTNGDSKFDGKIGEIAIWEGYELTLEDSKWLAGGGNPTAITGGTLVHYSRLEGGGSGEIDLISGAVGTLNGTPEQWEHPAIQRLAPQVVQFGDVAALNNERISSMHFQRHYEPIAMGK